MLDDIEALTALKTRLVEHLGPCDENLTIEMVDVACTRLWMVEGWLSVLDKCRGEGDVYDAARTAIEDALCLQVIRRAATLVDPANDHFPVLHCCGPSPDKAWWSVGNYDDGPDSEKACHYLSEVAMDLAKLIVAKERFDYEKRED